MENSVDQKFVFLGNLDVIEIIPGKVTVRGWVWDARMPAAKSEGFIVVGHQVLGSVIGSGSRSDLTKLGIGTNRGAFAASFEFPGIENLDFSTIRLISLDGLHRIQQNEVRIINHAQDGRDWRCPLAQSSDSTEESQFPAYQIVHNTNEFPDILEIRIFLLHDHQKAPRIRVSLDKGDYVVWTTALDSWKNSDADIIQNIRRTVLPLPPSLLDGAIHRLRIDLVQGRSLLGGLTRHLELPEVDPIQVQLQNQKQLTREYFSELSQAETQVFNLRFQIEDLEKVFRSEKENMDRRHLECRQQVTDLESRLANALDALEKARQDLAYQETTLQERQRILDALIGQKNAMMESRERITRILDEI